MYGEEVCCALYKKENIDMVFYSTKSGIKSEIVIKNPIENPNISFTILDIDGVDTNVFKRTLESVPEISSKCYCMNDENLTSFMEVISSTSQCSGNPLNIGKYALSKHADAYLFRLI